MTIPTILAQDATGGNSNQIPVGTQAVGYTTGPNVAWTTAEFAAHVTPYPAIRIDQDPNATDYTADILDVEAQAATVPEIVNWITKARANYAAHVRPEQRWPGIYCQVSNLNSAVAALESAGLTNVPFWLTEPGTALSTATTAVATATGSYPLIGVQYEFGTVVDYDVFSETWVKTMTGVKPVDPPAVQTGTITTTTGATAKVYTADGGQTWYYAPLKDYAGAVLNQSGTVHSDTTDENAKVNSTDGGLTWDYDPA